MMFASVLFKIAHHLIVELKRKFAALAQGSIRYLQLEIEFEDTVLINTPAWIAHP